MATEFTLRQARYFLAAVETGSMAAAARLMHVSPSAVSLAVSALEEVLDTSLLIRFPHRPLTLTTTGSAIIGDVRRLVNASEDLLSKSRAEARLATGRLHVGCFRTLAPTLVPQLVEKTTESYPSIELVIDELSLEELQAALLDGVLEVGLLYDLGIRPEVATEVLTLTKPYILLSAEHRLAKRKRVRLIELNDEPMVLLDVPPSKQYFSAILEQHGIEPSAIRTTGSVETLRSLVARNQGWSMLIQRPRIEVSYESLPIRSVDIADALEPMPVVAAWAAGTRLTHRAELFLQLCRDTIS